VAGYDPEVQQPPGPSARELPRSLVNIVETLRAAWIFELGWHGLGLLPTG